MCALQDRYEDRQREPRLTLRPPSLAAPYAPVQNWHHQPEKLIFESCGYEANVSITSCTAAVLQHRASQCHFYAIYICPLQITAFYGFCIAFHYVLIVKVVQLYL